MIPLNTRSHYSFMWGTASVNALCQKASASGYPALALTDTDNLCGMWQFIKACGHQGIQPIIGAELTDPHNGHRAVCLVKNAMGYSHLTRLISQRLTDKKFSLKTDLTGLSKGLVVLTRNHDLLPFWHENQVDIAVNLARNPLSRQHPLCTTARKLNIPMVATPGSFFLNRSDARIHRMLRAIATKTCLSRLDPRDLAPDTAFFAPQNAYTKRFEVHPLAIKNSVALAEKLKFHGPDFGIVMPPWKGQSAVCAARLLRQKTLDGARLRYGPCLTDRVVNRIDHELAIIQQKNFCEYFLVVEQIVNHASHICGRGSGAASIVAYCLGITNVCPIKYKLYFERFLNLDRADPPDIDIDFAWDERDEILNWVLTEFKGHAAMVSSHVLFQPRMAVREVARVFGLPEAEISRVSKRLPWFWKLNEAGSDLLARMQLHPEFAGLDFPRPWPDIIRYARAIIGTPRTLCVHPGGIVITPKPIDTYVPVGISAKGVPLMQWEKNGAEAAGLVKIDLLGNRSLGVVRDSIETIRRRSGAFNDFKTLDPEDDDRTRQTVAQGHTMGCFYIESPAMRLLQKKSGTGDFEHVVIHSSIIRPAANEFIQEYLKRLHTGTWKPIHPLLEDVLKDSFGIMVFQEDVSKVAVKIAGFPHAAADRLRKIISKKDRESELADYHARFKTGALANGLSNKDIQLIWTMILSFSGYSFCKPHSASYARVSFQCAYLKTHYPAEFMAAVISNQGGFYTPFAYVSEAHRVGIKILPPCVNQSDVRWKGHTCTLRVGFLSVKGLCTDTMAKLVAERKKADFSSIEDFLARVTPRQDDIRALVHSGCLDCVAAGKSRTTLLWAAAAWQKQKIDHHPSLFDPPPCVTALPDLPPDDTVEVLRKEFSVLGFLCAFHPMVLFNDRLQSYKIVKAKDLQQFVNKKITVAGWLLTGKTAKTKQGDPMKFLTFEDETGLVETVFFPKPYARFCHLLEVGKPYLLYGTVDSNWGATTLIVEKTCPIKERL